MPATRYPLAPKQPANKAAPTQPSSEHQSVSNMAEHARKTLSREFTSSSPVRAAAQPQTASLGTAVPVEAEAGSAARRWGHPHPLV